MPKLADSDGRYLNRYNFSQWAGVKPASVTHACRAKLAPALVRDGKLIDTAHPAAVAYKQRAELYARRVAAGRPTRGPKPAPAPDPEPAPAPAPKPKAPKAPKPKAPKAPKPKAPKRRPAPAPDPPVGVSHGRLPDRPHPDVTAAYIQTLPANIRDLADMSLNTLIATWGTDASFSEWLNAYKKIAGARSDDLKNAETEKKLVTRDLVHRAVIVPINTAFEQILTDGVKTIAVRARTIVESGGTDSELQKFIATNLGKYIKTAKARMLRALRDDG